ncbi:hypothetical protein D3C87_41170 [compost metagenome]
MADQLFHIIWTTFEEYPIHDNRGNWQKTKELYLILKEQQTAFQLSEEFPVEYLCKEPKSKRIKLSEKARNQLKADVEKLCQPGKDRIISGLKLETVQIHETHIELLVYCQPVSLKQKVSRLKSRSATLLSSDFPESYHGKNTWGKGIWIAQLFNPTASAVSTIKQAAATGKLIQ